MPDGRRLGRVSVVCVIEIAYVVRGRRGKEGNGDWVRDPKVGQLTYDWASKGRGSQLHTKIRYSKNSERFTHAITNIMY